MEVATCSKTAENDPNPDDLQPTQTPVNEVLSNTGSKRRSSVTDEIDKEMLGYIQHIKGENNRNRMFLLSLQSHMDKIPPEKLLNAQVQMLILLKGFISE